MTGRSSSFTRCRGYLLRRQQENDIEISCRSIQHPRAFGLTNTTARSGKASTLSIAKQSGDAQRWGCSGSSELRTRICLPPRKAPETADDEAALRADITNLAKRFGRHGYRRMGKSAEKLRADPQRS
ncbi:MAG: hypothetical protein JWO26_3718 [Rhodospirillales bacterium]|jgi:hypothetical protein|nr:hypothetical protein [Rhodospirillales bacterium]